MQIILKHTKGTTMVRELIQRPTPLKLSLCAQFAFRIKLAVTLGHLQSHSDQIRYANHQTKSSTLSSFAQRTS
ncbi:hypothetical protein VIGAN_04166200, partial [Vigna angularis var. angularis]